MQFDSRSTIQAAKQPAAMWLSDPYTFAQQIQQISLRRDASAEAELRSADVAKGIKAMAYNDMEICEHVLRSANFVDEARCKSCSYGRYSEAG